MLISARGVQRPSLLAAILFLLLLPALLIRSHRAEAMADLPERRLCGGVYDAPPGSENDLEAIDLARFAVAEHNSKTNGMLEFERLVKVRHQLVAGMLYYFTVEVKEGGAKKLYEAQVWEKLWENFLQLHSFEPVTAETTAVA
ncbi:hypothetical protein PR202_ga05544 [Eleusine coracana subsp. coracana]|uniref:Cysteine proteinase inhibitor n=1 Tax=Eleusine coracana subsp. coracana TaxID=191504 RepID=A0AAV5BUW9_ELECO|nr:hypothetical protein QOZ80_5AG0368390 [Eleusine coracana subsp. coracana]GJM88957.1 hypothetical protein PR202_ga05091 [Eleusine coracana subsp. coracana]GJM89358.1 hypothetical protein PR202_ga05544 [Eleusine coracana subsp. coracana]